MRILMLAQAYPPAIGGEEQHVRNLGIELVKRGHEVAVATLWTSGQPDFMLDEGVRVYRIRGTVHRMPWLFSTAERFAPPFPDPELVASLRRIMAREDPEIVHAHNWLIHAFLPLKAWSRARLVLTLHDYSLACVQKRYLHRNVTLCTGPGVRKCLECAATYYGRTKGVATALANWAMSYAERRAVDMFLPVSRAVADTNGLTGSSLPFQVIPNFIPDTIGVSLNRTSPLIAELPKEDFLLYVGDLTYDKGLHVLLDAYAGLVDAPPLVLIGRVCPDTPTQLPDGVSLQSSWPHEAVMGAWHASAVGLMPSIVADACPTVAFEAMATGRPVIGSRIGGLSDIVADGETGLLIVPGDAVSLRQAMARLWHDVDLRQRMGQAGQRRVPQFQASSVVPRIEHVYGAVLGGKSRVQMSMQRTLLR